jgi:5-methylcytosine-specific restriction endonuclease McrA
MERTLLLSNGYEPLGTIGWQRAISLLTLGKVEVVEEYDREVRSTHLVIKMPAVVRLVNFFRRHKQRVKFSRQNILARDRWLCQYCDTKVTTQSMTMDHVVPRAQGGRTEWENIVTCCEECNSRKADKTPAQAKMRLKRAPVRPEWVPVFSIQLSGPLPEQWATYLYWTTALEPG